MAGQIATTPFPALLDWGHFMFEPCLQQLASWENLHLAWKKASKGKRKKAEVAAFEHRLEDNLLLLSSQLLTQQWEPSGYRSFFIHDPKRRLISAAPFKDRVVHHALCNVIEPAFERSFITDSYANRVGKGNHKALEIAQNYSRRFPYVLVLDVRKFFPSIDHEILYQRLAKKIDNDDILHLIKRILDSGVGLLSDQADAELFDGDDLVDLMKPKGLPIGNLTSQFWANVYMSPLDHFVKRELRCKAYVRFVDDAEWQNGLIDDEAVLQSVLSWNNHVSYGNTVGLRKAVFSVLPRPLAIEARERYERIFRLQGISQ